MQSECIGTKLLVDLQLMTDCNKLVKSLFFQGKETEIVKDIITILTLKIYRERKKKTRKW